MNNEKYVEEAKKISRRIRDRNRRFKKLSPEKKRVAIAKDVLKQLELGQIKASTGAYFAPVDGDFYVRRGMLDPQIELGAFLEQEECQACAIGSVFIAATKKADECRLSGFVASRASMTSYLSQWFTNVQLTLMECAFECSDMFARKGGLEAFDSRVRAAVAFGNGFDYADDTGRLKAIMENIIANSGEFRP